MIILTLIEIVKKQIMILRGYDHQETPLYFTVLYCTWKPPDAMSLSYADTSLPDLLGRPASNMQTKPPLCSKQASTIQHSFC